MGWPINAMPRPLYPRELPSTHYVGGWEGPTARYRSPRNQMDLEEIRRESVNTVIWVRVGATGSLLWTPSLAEDMGGEGILGLGDNLLANQGFCSIEILCFLRHTVSTNSVLFMNTTVLKLRRPHYETINSKLQRSSSTVSFSLCYQYISRSYSYFHCSSCNQFVI